MQKRWLMIALMATFLTGCGCGPKPNETPTSMTNNSQMTNSAVSDGSSNTVKPTRAKDEIEIDLTTQGWLLKTINAGELGLSDRPNITQSFGGYEPNTGWLIYALWFLEEEDAANSYDYYVPDEGAVEHQDGENYKQSFITLENGEGVWLVRQVDQSIFGVWAPNGTDQASMTNVLVSFHE